MKTWIWLGCLVVLMLCAFCAKESTTDADEVIGNLSMAMNKFQSGMVPEGVDLVLDSVMKAAEGAGIPREFKGTMTAIGGQEKFFSPETPALLREAYQMTGHDLEIPESSGEIGTVAEAVRIKLLAAQENLRTGERQDAVRSMLESLMVMMPTSPQ